MGISIVPYCSRRPGVGSVHLVSHAECFVDVPNNSTASLVLVVAVRLASAVSLVGLLV